MSQTNAKTMVMKDLKRGSSLLDVQSHKEKNGIWISAWFIHFFHFHRKLSLTLLRKFDLKFKKRLDFSWLKYSWSFTFHQFHMCFWNQDDRMVWIYDRIFLFNVHRGLLWKSLWCDHFWRQELISCCKLKAPSIQWMLI